jgi:hypothetical protein
MAISIKEMLDRIRTPGAELYVLSCTELLVFDRTIGVLYIPEATHGNSNLNPIGDLRTYIGHGLLWSHHTEIEGSSADLYKALISDGYEAAPYYTHPKYRIFSMAKRTAA